ncbi:uncharacterized protein LOC135472168 isoform X2 [Liolophura sinensis]|uniref:uncharacterized protein LOC135472168 isoform X2 n=1 Tax=Liolophura sinensis TaxID=3198878 RepID=UPI00315815A8
MSNSRRKKLTSRVDEDASPTFSMVNLRQETTSMENTMKDHMDKTEADIKPLTLHIETSAGDLSGCVSPDAVPFTPETGCVRPNTYSVAPRTTPAQQTPSNAQQSTASAHQVPSGAGHCEAPPPATRPQSRSPPDNFPAKSKCGKDDLPDDISLQLQVSVNALLDRESGHSNEDKKLSNKAVSVSSSSKTVSSSSASVSSSSVPVSSSSATSYAVAVSSSSSEELCVSTMKLSEEEDDDIPDSMVPVEVGLRCYDILLLHSEDEPENAWEVKKHLETELLLSNGERIQVLLYEELVQIFRRQIGCLKEGMDHCTFVFILITKTFCESDLSRFLGEECLIKSIHDANKRWSVVPLFTQPKRSADYCIPTGLNCLKGISYHTRDEFYSSNMIKMIEQRRYIKNEREKKRLKRIKNWKEDKRHELLMERIKEEQREKQAKDLKEMQLQQLKKSLENAPVNPSYMAITSSSYNMPQAANSCKYPNTEQLGNFPPFPYPWTNPYGYPQYPHGQPMHLTMSYPHLQQAWGGYGMPPGFGGITESHSMPGNMAEMAGYSVGEQHGGHTVTLGARPPPYHQSDGKALEQAGLRRGPEPTEQIDTSLDGHKLSSKNEDTGQGTSSARFDTGDRCSDPKTGSSNNEMKTKEGLLKEQSFDAVTYLREEEPSTDPQRFPRTKKDYRQGSDNSTAYSETGFRESDQHEASLSQAVPIQASQSLPQASVSSSAHEHDEQAVTHHAGSCTDPLLDSSVEEDATKQIEETSVKQHLDGLRVRESSSTRAHGAPPATDSGYASSSRSTSKISTASYIQQSLGLTTPTKQSHSGVEQEDAQRSRSKTDSLSSSWTSESDSLSSALLAESVAESREQQFTGRTEQHGSVLREIHHHHHHHDSEAKKVIIIQNCDTVHLGDRSTVQNIPHDVAQYRTGHQGWDDRSETWQGEAGVWMKMRKREDMKRKRGDMMRKRGDMMRKTEGVMKQVMTGAIFLVSIDPRLWTLKWRMTHG